jgi:hypothetical protein
MEFQRDNTVRRHTRPKCKRGMAARIPRLRFALVCAGHVALVGIALLANSAILHAADPTGGKATNSRAAREEAVQAIPMDKLSREMRARISTVVNNASIYRRLPMQSIDCDPELFEFLVQNPEVVVDIWRVMGITNMTLDRNGPDRFRAADGQGTTGNVEFAFRSPELHIIVSEGVYDGPMYPVKLRGQCVLVMKTSHVREQNGRIHVVNRLDAFLRIENLGVEIVARTLQPLLGKTADHNFAETSAFVDQLSHTAEANPGGVSRLAQRLTHIEPKVRQQFAELAEHVADNAAAQAALAQSPSKPSGAIPAAARVRQSSGETRDR